MTHQQFYTLSLKKDNNSIGEYYSLQEYLMLNHHEYHVILDSRKNYSSSNTPRIDYNRQIEHLRVSCTEEDLVLMKLKFNLI